MARMKELGLRWEDLDYEDSAGLYSVFDLDLEACREAEEVVITGCGWGLVVRRREWRGEVGPE